VRLFLWVLERKSLAGNFSVQPNTRLIRKAEPTQWHLC